MADFNPYASPRADAIPPVIAAKVAPTKGMWAKGKVLVMHRTAQFPNVCVKSNTPAARRLTRNLSWHHPAIALSILAGLLVYVILALVLTKRAVIRIPLSDAWFQRRRRAIIIGWSVGLAGVATFIGGFFLLESFDALAGFCFLGGVVMALGGAIYGSLASRMVWPERIDDRYIYLRGVNREFLAALPAWSGAG